MALTQSVLVTAMEAFIDPDAPGFTGFPTASSAPLDWANALQTYFLDLAAPPAAGLIDPTQVIARDAFAAAFIPIFSSPIALTTLLPNALVAYAALITTLPAVGVTVPPPSAPVFIPPMGAFVTGAAAIATMAGIIDTWARTGTFTPFGMGLVPWS